ncbi:MAG: dihydroorotate dehydrogenase-like protein [Terrimicrobiaceae bacterium]|nr:dihydroorotate dehydrogenase-like protein [Terrimicrobiaceae bacterium]
MNLATDYLGLHLRTPLVPSASPLSEDADNLLRMEDAGASAVVLHSLFEEQVRHEQQELRGRSSHGAETDAEARSGFPDSAAFLRGPQAYLRHIEKAQSLLSIPVIASLNGSTPHGWTSFAREIEQAGANALELNIYHVPADPMVEGSRVEEDYLRIVLDVREAVKIPLAVKVSPFFTSFAHMAKRLVECGANGLVLFNRFYQPDLDLKELEIVPDATLSHPGESRLALRWIALLYGRIGASLAATGGIYSGADALKLLMAGADVTMLCSALLRHGIAHIKTVEREMIEWMEEIDCKSIEQLKGSLSQEHCADPSAFERAHYIRAVGSFTSL